MKIRCLSPLGTPIKRSMPTVNGIRQLFRKTDPTTILNRDLFLANAKLNSSNKVNYEGMKPSFYSRSAVEFDSQFVDRLGMGNNRILERLHQDKHFSETIASRLQPIDNFLGSNFPLTTVEKLSIICGLSNLNLELSKPSDLHKICVESDKLRLYGKLILQLHLNLETVFTNEKYLSYSKYELNHDIQLFETSSLIPLFMKNNQLYNSIIPFKGSMRSGKIEDPETCKATKEQILDRTSIGSFYTLIGLLCTKFNKQKVIDEIVVAKIIQGPRGIVSIATNEFMSGSS